MRTLAGIAFALAGVLPIQMASANWFDLATVSMTTPNAAKLTNRHVCITDGRSILCEAPSPYVSTGGLVGINTTNPNAQLDVYGTISATNFIGDGSGLTGVIAGATDRIVSGSIGGTRMVAVSQTGFISITQAGANSGWFSPYTGLVTLGVSATGGISGTTGFFSGSVGIGKSVEANRLDVDGIMRAVSGSDALPVRGVGLELSYHGSVGRGRLVAYDRDSSEFKDILIGPSSSGGFGMTITSNSFVAIGKFLPRARLDVVGTISASDAIQVGTSGLSCSAGIAGALRYSGFNIEYCNGTSWGALVGAADAMGDRIVSGSTNIIANQNQSLTFTTAGVERMVLGADGRLNVSSRIQFVSGSEGTTYFTGRHDERDLFSIGRVGLLHDFVLRNDGRIGIGLPGLSTTPTAMLDVRGNISASDAIQVGTSALTCGAGIPGAIRYQGTSLQYCNGTTWTSLAAAGAAAAASSTGAVQFNVGNALAGDTDNFFWDNANKRLGIGTSAPAFSLDVSRSHNAGTVLSIGNQSAGGDAYSGLTLQNSQGVMGWFWTGPPTSVREHLRDRVVIQTNGGGTANRGVSVIASEVNHDIRFLTGGYVPAVNERMRITGTGDVGIGTSTPTATLTVSGTISATNAIQVGTSSLTCGAGIPGAIRYQGTSLQYCNGTSWTSLSVSGGGLEDRIVSGSTNIIANQNQSLTFSTAGTQRMVIGANGLVGIGTSNPNNALHVDIQSLGDRRHIFLTNSDMPFSRVSMGDGTSTPGQFSPTFQGYSVGAIRGTGFYGNIDSLDDSGTSPVMFFASRIVSPSGAVVATRPLFDWRNHTASQMLMDASGQLGIGTSTPRARLDVAGTISASDAIQVGTSSLACTNPISGSIRYNAGALELCNGTTWGAVSGGGALGDRIVSGSASVVAYDNDGPIIFSTSGVERMRVLENGGVQVSSSNHLTTIGGSLLLQRSQDAASHPRLVFRASRGSVVTPTNVQAGDNLGSFAFTAYNNSTFQSVDGNASAVIRSQLEGIVGGDSAPANIMFRTTGPGETSNSERMRISPQGRIGIGTTSPLGNLDVSGTISATDAVQVGTSALTCSAGIAGAMRYTSGTMQVCNGTDWGNIGIGVPTGTIAAFATANCPSGWNPYTPAQGRFLRGIDPTGTQDSVRAAGNVQQDALENITGSIRFAANRTNVASTPGTGAFQGVGGTETDLVSTGTGTSRPANVDFDASRVVRTANETRPKNVAVRFCMYAGFESAVATGITTLGGLSDVSVGGATTGQVLAFDGASWVASDTTGGSIALGDRITSGTHTVTVNESTGYVRLSTSGTDWGYLGSGASFLPTLAANRVSTTNISATYLQLNSPTTVLSCGAGLEGAMRYTSGTMQVCDGANWGNVGIGVPTGTISAFASSNCPSGWNPYTPAQGRFLRGIDPAGINDTAGRSAGDVQADAMQRITGNFRIRGNTVGLAAGAFSFQGAYTGNVAEFQFTGGNVARDYFGFDSANSPDARTDVETRPKNVAVRFCMYAGFESAVATGITTLGGLSDVAVGGVTTGQVLAFDGASWVPSNTTGGSTALGDRITSGTHVVVMNENSGYVSLSTAGTTWGHFSNVLSYLPTLTAGRVSATNVSASVVDLNGASIGAVAGPGGNFIASGTTSVSASSNGTVQIATAGTFAMTVLSNRNVGIGTEAPDTKLDVVAVLPTLTIRDLQTSTNNARSALRFAESISGPNRLDNLWEMGANIGTTGDFRDFAFRRGKADADTGVVAYEPVVMTLYRNGFVGIGVEVPSHILHISGQGRSTEANWATSSDRRVKEDIHSITGGLGVIEKLRPVTFRYTEEYRDGNGELGGVRRGFIAQEVEAVLPDAVRRDKEMVGKREIDDFRVLGNSDFVPLLVSAVKELKAANDNVEQSLREEIDELRRELRELKQANNK